MCDCPNFIQSFRIDFGYTIFSLIPLLPSYCRFSSAVSANHSCHGFGNVSSPTKTHQILYLHRFQDTRYIPIFTNVVDSRRLDHWPSYHDKRQRNINNDGHAVCWTCHNQLRLIIVWALTSHNRIVNITTCCILSLQFKTWFAQHNNKFQKIWENILNSQFGLVHIGSSDYTTHFKAMFLSVNYD